MEIVIRKIVELHPTQNNSRTHTTEQIAQIAKSIQTFGFTNPVLISGADNIIAGHGRVRAAALLKQEEVPTITLDNLTDDEIRAYIIADNQLALNAGWDFEILKVELAELGLADFDISILGFDEAFISTVMQDINFPPGNAGDQPRLDKLDPIMVTCPECAAEFDARERKNAEG